MQMTRKIFTRATASLFFNRFSGDILFSSLVSFAFFILVFLFVCLFVCSFLKLKMYILLHIRLCGRVSDNKIFTRPISGNKTFFYGLTCCFCLKYFLVLKGVGITKVIEWQFIFSSSKRLLLVKEVSNGSGQNLLATKYKTLYMIENFIYLFYDSMYIGFYALYRLVIT